MMFPFVHGIYGSAALPWYLSGGAPAPIAVYEPKGAASLAASYVNIVNPGTYNATPGNAPAWDAVKGWKFTAASSHYLKLGIVPSSKNYTVFVCYSNANQAFTFMVGTRTGGSFSTSLILLPNYNYTAGAYYAGTAVAQSTAGKSLDTCAYCLAGPNIYVNGTSVATVTQNGTDGGSLELYLGAYNNGGSAGAFWGGNVQCVAIWDEVVDAAGVAAVSAAALALVHASYTFNTAASAADNAASPLTTVTYDGSGQAVHPDVVYNASGWNGYKYWMAMTPYPNYDESKENPSILASNDGDTWVEPAGITNPVVAALVAPAFNSDPDLIFSPDGVTLWMFYRSSNAVDTDTIHVMSSTDGITWSAATDILSGGKNSWVSPGVVYDGSQYVMLIVNVVNKPNTLHYFTCSTPNGTWSAATRCTVHNTPAGKELWHLDININSGVYQGLFVFCDVNTNGGNTILYFAQSADGLEWIVEDNPALSPAAPTAWDDNKIYRASGLIISGGYDLFYSAETGGTTWRIGRTTLPVT